MSIETVEDIIENIADRIGVYGGHCDDEGEELEGECNPQCRVCFVCELRERLDAAYAIERKLNAPQG